MEELKNALASKIGESDVNDALVEAMASLLVILLQRIKVNSPAVVDLSQEITNNIRNKYPRYSGLANTLMPSPS